MADGRASGEMQKMIRFHWIDAAKGVSIILLVLHHAYGDKLPINSPLSVLRMPLFFFVAGLFAAETLNSSWKELFRRRIANYIYLYVVWASIVFLSTVALIRALSGKSIDWGPLLTIFWAPPQTLWFLYALAIAFIVAKLLLRISPWISITLAVAGYLVAMALPGGTFMGKVVRLLPFFLMGTYALGPLKAIVERWSLLLMAGLVLFVIVLAGRQFLPWQLFGVASFVASVIGIVGVCGLTYRLSGTAAGRVLTWVGASSLYIYVMHRIVLFHGWRSLRDMDLRNDMLALFGLAIAAIVVTALAGRFLADHGGRFLFSSDWMFRRRSSHSSFAPG